MEDVRSSFSPHWLTLSYFTKGISFFLYEEAANIFFLGGLMYIIDLLRGTATLCFLVHLGIIVLTRRVLAGGICTSSRRLDGKTVVVTGCNVGIGKETARDFSRRGAKVIMACRDTKTAEKVAGELRTETGGQVVVLKLDLASLTSVRAFVQDLKAKEKWIHILVNNAGVMWCPYMKTEDGFEMQMGTNHLGHYLLTRLLLPLLTHAEPARIINISSLAHARGCIPFDDMTYSSGYNKVHAYGNSKLANVLFTRQLAKELKGTNIQVFAVHPGAVQSNLSRHIMSSGMLKQVVGMMMLKTTAEGAQTTIHCAVEASQQDHHYFSDCGLGYCSAAARDDESAKKLWDLSEKLVGLAKDSTGSTSK